MSGLNYGGLVKKLKEIKEMGFVKTHRIGNTGIGKTLEDLLGIEENNVPSPDAEMIELKSARKNAKSMITLFTKAPLPPKANSVLLERFGYPSAKGTEKKELHTTVNAAEYNKLKGKAGFKIEIKPDKLHLVSPKKEVLGYWDKKTLEESFERKLPQLVYVEAETNGKGVDEQFWFNEAWLLHGFDFENFIDLLKKKIVFVDIRIGQFPDGRTHDHGTGFRIFEDKLDLCFENREKIM